MEAAALTRLSERQLTLSSRRRPDIDAILTISVRINKLRGSIPNGLRSLQSLSHWFMNVCHLHGTLPEQLGCLTQLRVWDFFRNALQGAVPDAISGLMWLRKIDARTNKLSGALPMGLAYLMKLERVDLSENWLQGTLQGWQRSLISFVINENMLAGSLPDEDNDGALDLRYLDLCRNALVGSLPNRIMFMRSMRSFWARQNEITGALPSSLQHLKEVSKIVLGENLVSGALPHALCALKKLEHFEINKNMLEGPLLPCLPVLSGLVSLTMSASQRHNSGMYGSLPRALCRLRKLTHLVAQSHHFRGVIPAFGATFDVLVLHKNELSHLPRLKLMRQAGVFLHCNRLSCALSKDQTSRVRSALVAVGNHLTKPEGRYPAWVSPYERDGVLWIEANSGFWLLLQVIASCSALAAGHYRAWSIYTRMSTVFMWKLCIERHRRCTSLFSSLLKVMATHALGGLLLLMLVFDYQYYLCPETLTWASACLSQSSRAQILVVVLWGRSWSQARQPLWSSRTEGGGNGALGAGMTLTMQSCWSWALWTCLVTLLSVLAVVSIATKSIPAFLQSRAQATWILNAGIGAWQGMVNSAIIPALAGKMSAPKIIVIPKAALVSFAVVFSGCVLPGFIVLYLDTGCLNHWVMWWTACKHRSAGWFDMRVPVIRKEYVQMMSVLRQNDVCSPERHRTSMASCARSIAHKLQTLFVGKLVTMSLLEPAGRLLTGQFYSMAGGVLVKLGFLLQMCILLGASLPLVAPILYLGVVAEQLLFAASFKGMNARGADASFGSAFLLVGLYSSIFHYCFVSEDALASWLVCVFVVLAYVEDIGRAILLP